MQPISLFNRDEIPDLFKRCLADAGDLLYLLDGGEGPVFLPVGDDLLGGDRPDARQGFKFLLCGGVDVDEVSPGRG